MKTDRLIRRTVFGIGIPVIAGTLAGCFQPAGNGLEKSTTPNISTELIPTDTLPPTNAKVAASSTSAAVQTEAAKATEASFATSNHFSTQAGGATESALGTRQALINMALNPPTPVTPTETNTSSIPIEAPTEISSLTLTPEPSNTPTDIISHAGGMIINFEDRVSQATEFSKNLTTTAAANMQPLEETATQAAILLENANATINAPTAVIPTFTQTPEPTATAPETATPAPSLTPIPTDTLTPTQTQTPEPTSTSTDTVTPNPTATLPPTEAPTSEEISANQTYPGEFTFNNLAEVHGQTIGLMEAMKLQLLEELEAYNNAATDEEKAAILRTNSTLSSLVNPFGKGVSADPATEPGLGQTKEDIQNYVDIRFLISQTHQVKALDILHQNSNGLWTVGIYGNANDRDAIMTWLATGMAFYNTNQNVATVADAWQDPQKLFVIQWWQGQMLAQVQNKSLGVSQIEQQRRSNNDPTDMSVYLPSVLQTSDQWDSCDVNRTDAESRTDQLQSTRLVAHKEQQTVDFTHANSQDEMVLFVLAIDPTTGIWDVDAFTNRSYPGKVANQEASAVGEEMRPCGRTPREQRGTLVPTTIRPVDVLVAQPTQPGNTPENPETPEIIVTQAQTQPPQPTRTPGGNGATPIVATPEPTNKPTEVIVPTVPAALSSTPAF